MGGKHEEQKIVNILLIIALIILIIFTTTILLKMKNENKIYKYTIIIDSKYTTMLNDGGSHYNVYYEIDLNQSSAKKYEDSYIGFKGYEYRGKLIYSKVIKDNTIKDLSDLLKKLIYKKDINESNNYSPFVIKYDGNEKEIYNLNSIKLLKEKLLLIDEY